jgi:hypothetical protein
MEMLDERRERFARNFLKKLKTTTIHALHAILPNLQPTGRLFFSYPLYSQVGEESHRSNP